MAAPSSWWGPSPRPLVQRGHDVVLYATGDSHVEGAEVRYRYEEAIWPPDPWRELNHAAFAMRDIAASGDFDVIHAHVAPALAYASFVDVPMIYTIHHVHEARLHELYESFASPSLTLVAISARQRDLLGYGLSAEVVHHGLRSELYPLGRGGGYAAFIGRFAEEKGVHVAIDVAARAHHKLRLAGQPHWKDETYFQAEVRHRLQLPHVTWVGEAAHPAKVRLLGSALATLFPIDWEEPFGLVMIESMLCGTPVLSFARGSAPEVIEQDVTGWAVADEDEMIWRLRQLAAGRTRFDRARCRERAIHRFSVNTMVERYLQLYAASIGRPVDADKVLVWPAS
jgi:glycosyltransferase involved in cell wall biosynthesis